MRSQEKSQACNLFAIMFKPHFAGCANRFGGNTIVTALAAVICGNIAGSNPGFKLFSLAADVYVTHRLNKFAKRVISRINVGRGKSHREVGSTAQRYGHIESGFLKGFLRTLDTHSLSACMVITGSKCARSR